MTTKGCEEATLLRVALSYAEDYALISKSQDSRTHLAVSGERLCKEKIPPATLGSAPAYLAHVVEQRAGEGRKEGPAGGGTGGDRG